MSFSLKAFIKIAQQQQEEAERQFRKEQEERKRRQEAIKRQKRFLEAAFDGDNDELAIILREVNFAAITLVIYEL